MEGEVVGVDVVLDRHLHGEARLGVDVGQRQQVGRAHEEVAVKRVNTNTCTKITDR